MRLLLRHADWTSPFWIRDDRARDHGVGGAGRDALRPCTAAVRGFRLAGQSGRAGTGLGAQAVAEAGVEGGVRAACGATGHPGSGRAGAGAGGSRGGFGTALRAAGSRQRRAGVGGRGRRPAQLGRDDGGEAPSGLEARAGRAGALLDPFFGAWRAGGCRLLGRELAPEGARRMDRLVGRRAGGASRPGAVQSPFSAFAPHPWSGVAGVGDGDGAHCGGLERSLCSPARAGLYLCQPGTFRRVLPGGRMVLLLAADLRPTAGEVRSPGRGARSG